MLNSGNLSTFECLQLIYLINQHVIIYETPGDQGFNVLGLCCVLAKNRCTDIPKDFMRAHDKFFQAVLLSIHIDYLKKES